MVVMNNLTRKFLGLILLVIALPFLIRCVQSLVQFESFVFFCLTMFFVLPALALFIMPGKKKERGIYIQRLRR